MVLSNIAYELSFFLENSQLYLFPWSLCLGALWVINILNWLSGSKLNAYGIQSRRVRGLTGIIICPIIHQNFNHLFFNSIPLFVLGLAILAQDLKIFYTLTAKVIIIGGGLVWLLGRRSIHIGASGLVSGYFGYIVYMAYYQPGITSIFVAIFAIYYFGSIFFGIFPQEERVSWESHLFGFVSGIASFYTSSFYTVRGKKGLFSFITFALEKLGF